MEYSRGAAKQYDVLKTAFKWSNRSQEFHINIFKIDCEGIKSVSRKKKRLLFTALSIAFIFMSGNFHVLNMEINDVFG